MGCLLAQAIIFGVSSMASRLQHGPSGQVRPGWKPGPKAAALFVRYAAPVAVAAALLILGVWTVTDYLATRSTPSVPLAWTPGPSGAALATARASAAADVAARPGPQGSGSAQSAADNDPYGDPEFKVQHRGHRPGSGSLKDALLQKSELKASAELRRETQQHQQRSQYDCEAADRADRYLKAGLDVWGFAAWQQRYFPIDAYKGATLEQCRDIKAVIPGSLDLQATVAQQTR
jgi:hypothetical protein